MSDEITYYADGNVQSFVGPSAVQVYVMAVLASALKMYANTGMRVNRAYTPTAMMRAAREHLGVSAEGIGARDYLGMSEALRVLVQSEKARIAAIGGQR